MSQPSVSVPQEERRHEHDRWQLAVVLTVALLMVIIIVLSQAVPASAPVAIADDQHVNPELRYAESYALEAARRAEVLSLGINPELQVYERYVSAAAVPSLAANPELMAAARYTAPQAERQEAAFLAANPEVRSFQRYQLEYGR